MMHQKSKIVHILMVAGVAGVFVFMLYVLLTTKNTIIVVNEAASEPKEVVAEPVNPPAPETTAPAPNPRVQILETGVGFLNVRDGASPQAAKIGKVKPGEVYEYTEVKDNWYHIVHPTLKTAWVSGQYVKEVDRSSDLFGSSTSTAP